MVCSKAQMSQATKLYRQLSEILPISIAKLKTLVYVLRTWSEPDFNVRGDLKDSDTT